MVRPTAATGEESTWMRDKADQLGQLRGPGPGIEARLRAAQVFAVQWVTRTDQLAKNRRRADRRDVYREAVADARQALAQLP
jgi:hypothetical protein